MQNDYEVKYWARHFGVTQKHLRLAIEKVGNSAASVRKELFRTALKSDAEQIVVSSD